LTIMFDARISVFMMINNATDKEGSMETLAQQYDKAIIKYMKTGLHKEEVDRLGKLLFDEAQKEASNA
jgi:hypothetical protein